MSAEEKDVLDTQIKGITVKIAWRIIAGYTSIIVSIFFIYFSLKSSINDASLVQARTDAIQDLRIDGLKRDIELENLQIRDLNERFNELKSQTK
jgi:hypothetical protein